MLTHSTEQDIKFSGVTNPRKSILVPVPHMTNSGSILPPSHWFLTTPYTFYTPLLVGLTLHSLQSSRLIGLHDPLCLMQSFNHPNLYYAAVQPKPSMKKKAVQAIAGFIKSQHATHTGIVHGFLKLECEELAEQLRNDYGLSAKHYRTSMGPQEHSTTQDPSSTSTPGSRGGNILESSSKIFFMCPPPLGTYLVPPAFTTFLPVLRLHNMANTYSPGPHIPYHANAFETPHAGSSQFAPAPAPSFFMNVNI
ncbi:uncharacterized protein F5891DRAFT_1201395 [Suillus fuscotomentosus]|uniref:Uncharacterized protein n=1 Tax=Suillus fuscotomentosus TaxID=1912939 RepID=A0AAD4DNB7_9AGAM|nr:uncharacterized protein F5891DRAFT_1201395 [Suillus fuscotomentosus]KAG1885920.1 hypothetical protein F5891DRAFT_1201395 [Suillus fuscotomentosus]